MARLCVHMRFLMCLCVSSSMFILGVSEANLSSRYTRFNERRTEVCSRDETSNWRLDAAEVKVKSSSHKRKTGTRTRALAPE